MRVYSPVSLIFPSNLLIGFCLLEGEEVCMAKETLRVE